MTLFEVTLEGYDSSSPDTDDRVKWVKAPNRVMVEDFAAWQDWRVARIDVLENRSHYVVADGVDAILDDHGNVIEHGGNLKQFENRYDEAENSTPDVSLREFVVHVLGLSGEDCRRILAPRRAV